MGAIDHVWNVGHFCHRRIANPNDPPAGLRDASDCRKIVSDIPVAPGRTDTLPDMQAYKPAVGRKAHGFKFAASATSLLVLQSKKRTSSRVVPARFHLDGSIVN